MEGEAVGRGWVVVGSGWVVGADVRRAEGEKARKW